MAKDYIGQYQYQLALAKERERQIVETKVVYVATRALTYSDVLKPEDVREVRWPVNAIPEGTFTDLEALFPNKNEKPRLVVRAMEKGEALMTVKVTNPGEDIGLTTRLEKGMRAFAVKVDVASGVSGFLRPGDRVDVYWSGSVNDGEVTKLIESSVQLIAVDQDDNMTDGTRIARTVTVAVTPEQVAALAQAQATGSLSLSLVGAGDDTEVAEIQVNQASLLGLQIAQPREAAPVERVCTIRTRRGAEVVSIPIPCTN
jgi:pilus assembly protein CpaB